MLSKTNRKVICIDSINEKVKFSRSEKRTFIHSLSKDGNNNSAFLSNTTEDRSIATFFEACVRQVGEGV